MKTTEFFKKSKKAILIIGAAAMICFGFGGCGDKSNTAQDNTKSETTHTETQAKNDTSSEKENNSDTSNMVEYTTTYAKFKAPEGLKREQNSFVKQETIFITDTTGANQIGEYISFSVDDVGVYNSLPPGLGRDGKVPKTKEDIDLTVFRNGTDGKIIDFSYSEDDKSEYVFFTIKSFDDNHICTRSYEKYCVDKKSPNKIISINGIESGDTEGDMYGIVKSLNWK